jgi:hypothetical protein
MPVKHTLTFLLTAVYCTIRPTSVTWINCRANKVCLVLTRVFGELRLLDAIKTGAMPHNNLEQYTLP